jgi:C1A family cysteine protease
MIARKHDNNNRDAGAKPLKNFGWRPDLPDQRDHLYSIVHPVQVQLPPKLSLRDKFKFPVFDQGELGSCVANACCAQHMFVHKGETMMSRLDLYWSARYLEGTIDEDSGVMIRDGVKALQKFGVCTEKTWPYLVRKFAVDPPHNADIEALKYRITSYSRLSSLQDFQNCLANGYPFVFGFSVYSNIDAATTEKYGILTMPDKTMQLYGGHAVIAIGYDTDFHNNPIFKKSGMSAKSVPSFMFECRNSWSADWGDAGHFWIPADYLNDRNLSDDFWTIKA